MSKLVTIYGGSGFVGSQIALLMAKAGWRVRVAVRRPNEALHVKPYGAVGQVTPIFCNIRDDASVRAALMGADAVINCVGVPYKVGANTFDAVHVAGAARIARLASEQDVARLVHISAIGADAKSDAKYAATKGAGEAAILAAFPGAVILRPSVVFGAGDQFFNRFANLTGFAPVFPLVGAKTKFQPVFVGDLAQAALNAVSGDAAGVYELGGPDVATLGEFVTQMLDTIQRRKLIIPMPRFFGAIVATLLDAGSAVTMGLVSNSILTRDQLKMLDHDNVVADGARGLADLGVTPTPVHAVISEYLWPFRPSGQYAQIKDSAKKLRKAN